MDHNGLEEELDEALDEANKIAAEAQNVKPDKSELQSIKIFCEDQLKKKAILDESSGALKGLRAQQKDLKKKLKASLDALGLKCAMVSKADAIRLRATELPDMPHYLRLVSTNKDATITAEIVKESIESISETDMHEALEKKDAIGAIKIAILENIRRLIRTFSENVKMASSLQRGLTVYDIPEVTSATADLMFQYWSNEHAIKNALASKKVEPDPDAKDHKERVEAFFIRTGLTAQRIVIEGKPWRIVRRISIRKPKIGFGKIEKMLSDILLDFSSKKMTDSDIIREMNIQMANVAPETKSTMSLCAVKAAGAKAD